MSDARGNPVPDGVLVSFSLGIPVAGVTISPSSLVNQLPSCDFSSYVEATEELLVKQAGSALACLRYARSLEGTMVIIAAEVETVDRTLRAIRQVRLPSDQRDAEPRQTPRQQPLHTATRTGTNTVSPTPTPTATPTMTEPGTETPSPTITPTGSATPTPTVTETPTAEIRVAVTGSTTRPGDEVIVEEAIVDQLEEVYGLQFDMLFFQNSFTLTQIGQRCRADERTHQPSAVGHRRFRSVRAQGQRRFRFVLFDTPESPNRIGEARGALPPAVLPGRAGGSEHRHARPGARRRRRGPSARRRAAGERTGRHRSERADHHADAERHHDPDADADTDHDADGEPDRHAHPTRTRTPTRTATATPTETPTPTARTRRPTFPAIRRPRRRASRRRLSRARETATPTASLRSTS